MAEQHPRYGYRPITVLLNRAGWRVNHKRVQRLWRQEGLQLPRRKPRRLRVGPRPGTVYRATHKNQVWSYDFLEARTERGGRLRMLAVMDEYTRQCLAIDVGRSLPGQRVIQVLSWLFLVQGTPDHLRSDNGPEFVARAVQRGLAQRDCQTMYITPGSPWENPFIESFIGKLRNECLNRYLFTNGREGSTSWNSERQIETKEKTLADKQKKSAELSEKIAEKLGEINRNMKSLESAETREQQKRDQVEKKRRAEEIKHTKTVTRELEQQARVQSQMRASPFVIDFSKLPTKIKVVFFAASPVDQAQLRLDEEVRAITEKIRLSDHRDSVELISRWAVRPDDLLQALNEHRPHIIHFSGHGDEDHIAFLSPDGGTKLVTKDALVQLINTMQDNLRVYDRLIVL